MPRKASTTANRRAYQQTEKQKKARARRNKARRQAMAKGKVKKGDGKDVHHAKSDGKGKARVVSANYNRKLGGAKGGRKSSGGGRPRGS